MLFVARYPRWIAVTVAFAVLVVSAPVAWAQVAPASHQDNGPSCRIGDPFLRTELFFGTQRPDGSEVAPDQFQRFLDHEITPRFPDGLTLLTGIGQFRGSNGVIQVETSRLLILLYPSDTARPSSRKIEEIRDAYEQMFQQESVLRADDPLPQCVSF